jgi:hypothetical protein
MSVTDELLGGITLGGIPKEDKERKTLSSVTDEMLGIGRMQRAEIEKPSEAIADPRRSGGVAAAFRGGVPTNKQDAIKMFAEARGIPASRYKVIDGNIAYQAEDGKYYREVVMPTEAAAYYTPDVLEAAPSVAAGIATAPLSPAVNIPVAASVGAGANYLRQKISEQMTGGKVDPTQVVVSGLLSGAFESVPGVARLVRERRLASDIGSLDQNQISRLQQLSRQKNIPLTPAELTDMSSLQAQQKVLGNMPSSSKTMQKFYEKREVENIQPAVQDFLSQISRVDEPTQAGQMGFTALKGTEESLKAARQEAVDPLYKAAFDRSKPVNVTDVVLDIDSQLKTAKGLQESTLKKIKGYLYKDAPRLDPEGNVIDQKVLEDRLPALQNAKFNIDALFNEDSVKSLDATIQRQLMQVKDSLVSAMGRENPTYLEANKAFEELSAPLKEFGERKTGTSLTKISPDNLNQFAKRVFEGNSPDTVSYVKKQIMDTNPDAWQAVTRAYLQDGWETASKASAQQKGNVKLDVGNAWQNLLLGDVNKKKMLQRALEPDQYQALTDLAEVLRAAGSVKKLGSDTAFNQQIMKQMEKEAASDPLSLAGKMIGNVLSPQTIGTKISEWAIERSLARDANKVAEMITSPEGIKKLRELRQMSPTSAKRWAGTAQLLGNYGIIEFKD